MEDFEKYLDSLQENNDYCLCEEMQELYKLRRDVEEKLKEGSISINKTIRKYDLKLTSWVNKGKLELLLHNPKTDEIKEIFCSDIECAKAITANCPKCHNQIDVICQ